MQQQKIWSHFQNRQPESFDASAFRLDYLARQLERGVRVLNIGVGGAIFERLARARGAEVVTLDPDPQSLARHRDHVSGIAGLIQSLPFADRRFDVVVASEVLEHLSDAVLSDGVTEIARVLRPGGRFIGTVPADEVLADGTTICPHCGAQFHRWGHVQSFSAQRLRRLLEARLRVRKIRNYSFMYKTHSTLRARMLGAVRNVLVQTGILTRDRKLMFMAVRPESP